MIKTRAADTGGQLTIIEVTEPPDAEAPLHVHHREDEAFWILDGHVTLHIGDDVVEAAPATSPSARATSPTATASAPTAAGCCSSAPLAASKTWSRDMSRPAERRTLPPPSTEEPDWERVAAVAAANGCELLG